MRPTLFAFAPFAFALSLLSSCTTPNPGIDGSSDDGSVNLANALPVPCTNGVLDGAETDVDCGGPLCPACGTGKACKGKRDCQGAVCTNLVCSAPSCSDGVKNGSETDVDCGGSCAGCAIGKMCNTSDDCASATCTNGSCAPSPCMNGRKDGAETDMDCGGPTCMKCGDGKLCVTATDCTGGICANNTCKSPITCGAGTANCDGIAADGCNVNTLTDAMNCGGCGRACAALPNSTASCAAGMCGVGACVAGYKHCSMNAMDGCEAHIAVDPSNCGACGNNCPAVVNATPSCTAGVCGLGSCNVNFGNCDNNAANGCEKSLVSDLFNCGACGHACSVPNGTSVCNGGQCGIGSCFPSYLDCDHNLANGCEVNKLGDPLNCGACGTVCPAPPNATSVCTNGACTGGGFTCKPGFADCDHNPANGCEVDTTTPSNCGSCGVVCPVPANATAGCNAGVCGIGACSPGFGDCNKLLADGCEKSTTTDPLNCGTCGTVCTFPGATASCLNSMCGWSTCAPGFADCDGKAANGCEVAIGVDPNNCGMCGMTCQMNAPYCVSGACSVDDFPPVWFLYYEVLN